MAVTFFFSSEGAAVLSPLFFLDFGNGQKKFQKDAGDPPDPRRPQRPPRRRLRPAPGRSRPQRGRRRGQHPASLGRDARARRDHFETAEGRLRPLVLQRAGESPDGPLPGLLVPGLEVRQGVAGREGREEQQRGGGGLCCSPREVEEKRRKKEKV